MRKKKLPVSLLYTVMLTGPKPNLRSLHQLLEGVIQRAVSVYGYKIKLKRHQDYRRGLGGFTAAEISSIANAALDFYFKKGGVNFNE